jgi:hypothetical protein
MIAASMSRPRDLTVSLVAVGGATLRSLRVLPEVLQAIRAGNHDIVVLQDDIPEYLTTVDPFKEQVRWFNQEIRATKRQPVLYMAWAYPRLNWVTLATIAQLHREIGTELGLSVAPVGLAFEASTTQRPSLSVLDPGDDFEHPTVAGMYLAACVMYATIFRESPAGASWFPVGVSSGDAAFLQQLAWTIASS